MGEGDVLRVMAVSSVRAVGGSPEAHRPPDGVPGDAGGQGPRDAPKRMPTSPMPSWLTRAPALPARPDMIGFTHSRDHCRIGCAMEKKLSTDERVMAGRIAVVLLVRGESPDGVAIYSYVGIPGDRLQEFMAAQGSGTFYPEDFGVIIEAGEGEPSEDTRHKMETVWGFNHEAMADIADEEMAHEIMTRLPDTLLPDSQL